jgi:hypothetical protein
VVGETLKNLFEGEMTYMATVTGLAPKDGFSFSKDFTVTHSGSSGIIHVPGDASKAEVIFPKTSAFWEWGGYFSGAVANTMDSAIDIISLAKTENFSSLSLKLVPWPEEVDFDKTGTDIGTGLVLKAADNSPAAVTIDGGDKTITLTAGAGSVITVGDGVTLTLRNITFKGSDANDSPLISVIAGGTLVLENGAVITGNVNTATAANAGGVSVTGGGKLVMTGGTITGNTTGATNGGGGVSVYGGTFTMSGTAIISGNTTAYPRGEGVYVNGNGTQFVMNGGEISGHQITGVGIDNQGAFTMNGGKISDNHNLNTYDGTFGIYYRSGGGVRVGKYDSVANNRKATFTMNGGEITGNTALSGDYYGNYIHGGGAGVWLGYSNNASDIRFTMKGGTISGNTATTGYGGGVYIVRDTFTKTAGIIYGNDGTINANFAGTKGHAVYFQLNASPVASEDKYYDKTAGADVTLTATYDAVTGYWEWDYPEITTTGTVGSFDPYNTGVKDHWYGFKAVSAGTYQLQWEDKNNQSISTYNSDVTVSAYHSDFTTPFFTDIDSGYTIPQSINLTAGDKVYVKVTVKGSNPNFSKGAYLIRYIGP